MRIAFICLACGVMLADAALAQGINPSIMAPEAPQMPGGGVRPPQPSATNVPASNQPKANKGTRHTSSKTKGAKGHQTHRGA